MFAYNIFSDQCSVIILTGYFSNQNNNLYKKSLVEISTLFF